MGHLTNTGVPVHISSALPLIPSPGEDARRIVRHGMADVLAWLGEPVGPAPGEATHAVYVMGDLHVSREMFNHLTDKARDQ